VRARGWHGTGLLIVLAPSAVFDSNVYVHIPKLIKKVRRFLGVCVGGMTAGCRNQALRLRLLCSMTVPEFLCSTSDQH